MKQSIGEVICRCRQDRKMTQEEFAQRLGVTPQAVSKWERGNGLPDLSLVKGICRILDISANTLLGITDGKVVENDNMLMEQEIRSNLFAEPLLLEFGKGLIPCVIEGLKTDYVNQKRKELAKTAGMLMPVLRLKDNVELKESAYRILSYDKLLWESSLSAEDTDPVTNPVQLTDRFQEMIDRVAAVCEEHYGEILNQHIVKIMVDNIREFFPGAVEGLVPEKISYLKIERKMQEMLRQGRSIRDILHILEELEEGMETSDNTLCQSFSC